MNSWLNIPLVLLILGGLMLALRRWQWTARPNPELVRKLLHIPMGMVTLTFPWLFESVWQVAVLGGLAIAWLMTLRLYRPLAQGLGSVLGGVGRRSLGEVYFPLSVVILFALTPGQPLLYVIPILILALADAAAALVGTRYGQMRYVATEGYKSTEGSLSFFMATFFSVHVPLLLFSETGRPESLLIATILGLLVMLIEAIAWQGLDNLFIPLGSFLLLQTHLAMNTPALVARLVVLGALIGFLWLWRGHTTLNDGALLGAALVGYFCWSVGGWPWLLAPLTLVLCYPLLIYRPTAQQPLSPAEKAVMLWQPTEDDSQAWTRIHNVHAVLSVAAAGLLWLFLAQTFDRPQLIYPYTLAFAVNLAIICVAGLSPVHYWSRRHQWQVVRHILLSWLLLFGPLFILQGASSGAIAAAWLGLVGTALGAIAFYRVQPLLQQHCTESLRWVYRALFTTLVSCLGLRAISEAIASQIALGAGG
jgi:Dolichol kinase